MTKRVTYRRKHTYKTASNKIKKLKTPGSNQLIHYRTKKSKGPVCSDTGVKLHGIPHLKPKSFKKLSKPKKTVARAYGGSKSGEAVKTKITRAFLLDELKELKKIKTSKVHKKVTKKQK